MVDDDEVFGADGQVEDLGAELVGRDVEVQLEVAADDLGVGAEVVVEVEEDGALDELGKGDGEEGLELVAQLELLDGAG